MMQLLDFCVEKFKSDHPNKLIDFYGVVGIDCVTYESLISIVRLHLSGEQHVSNFMRASITKIISARREASCRSLTTKQN